MRIRDRRDHARGEPAARERARVAPEPQERRNGAGSFRRRFVFMSYFIANHSTYCVLNATEALETVEKQI